MWRGWARPNFGYLYDTFHSNIEERDPVGSIDRDHRGDPAHPHLGEPPRRAGQRATSTIAAAIRAAKAAGYDGWFTVEAFGQALPDLAAATRVWRPLSTARTRWWRPARG